MKVNLGWLKELVDFKLSSKELADKLSLVSIGVKEFSDDYIELDLTYNRGDLLSLRGVAREIAAITGAKLKFDSDLAGHEPKTYEVGLLKTAVKIEDENLSPVQCVAKIEGLKVETSSDEWVKKLKECGIRSVNNVADVTNLVMLEYGQPLHAFDEATIKDDTINVRLANKGEQIVTLDGKLRKLEPTDIVLADTEKSLDVAGVMGGKDTEIKESTQAILLSASMFNPVMVRKTAQRLGLHSEASKRFQHGLTKTNLLAALFAAIKMYERLGGKLTALTLKGDLEDKPKTITLTQEKLNSLMGLAIPVNQVESSLQSLGFLLESKGANVDHLEGGLAWHVTSSYFRLDINIEEDLIEEVARMYGYEKIPAQPLEGDVPKKLDESLQNKIHQLKVALRDARLTEVQTYSFFSNRVISNFQFPISNLVKIANPISSETEVLRDLLWPNLIEVVARNLKHGFRDIAIFEIGKVYSPKSGAAEEKYHLSIALMNGTDNPIQELAAIFSKVSTVIPAKAGIHLNNSRSELDSRIRGNDTLFHPTRNKDSMAEVHPRILNKLGIEKRVAILEVEIS